MWDKTGTVYFEARIRAHKSGIAQLTRRRNLMLKIPSRNFDHIILAGIFSQNILPENPYQKYLIENP
jgi:hypothetical protein